MTNRPTIFVDMDGVLADFDGGYEQMLGVRPSIINDNVDWQAVGQVDDFYERLPPMPDFDDLWGGIECFRPIILTGVPSSIAVAAANKRAWVDRHISPAQPMIACPSKDKSLHIRNPGDVLIDDWEKYRSLWLQRGGRWITHVTAGKSLAALADMLVG